MNSDRGREAVYAGELRAFGGTSFDEIVVFDELLWLRNALQAAAWWPKGEIAIERARSDARSSTTRLCAHGQQRLRIAASQCTPLTFAHEAGHMLAGVASGHGPLFRCAEIDVVEALFGSDPANWLRDAFVEMGLAVAERTWRRPDVGPLQRVIDLA